MASETPQQQADRAQAAMVAIQRMQDLLGNQVHAWTNRKDCPDSTTEQARQVQVELEGLRRMVAFDLRDLLAREHTPRSWSCGTTEMVTVAPGARNFIHRPGCQA